MNHMMWYTNGIYDKYYNIHTSNNTSKRRPQWVVLIYTLHRMYVMYVRPFVLAQCLLKIAESTRCTRAGALSNEITIRDKLFTRRQFWSTVFTELNSNIVDDKYLKSKITEFINYTEHRKKKKQTKIKCSVFIYMDIVRLNHSFNTNNSISVVNLTNGIDKCVSCDFPIPLLMENYCTWINISTIVLFAKIYYCNHSSRVQCHIK